MTAKKKTVIGLDLGHGETALTYLEDAYCRRGEGGFQPAPVFTSKPSQPTVLATLDDGKVVWGASAIKHSRVCHDTVTKFDISVKAKPGSDPATDEAIQQFAKCVMDDALWTAAPHLNDNDIEWFVGCPNGWGPAIQAKYAELFKRAGMTNVRIVKESRAAFTYYYENHKPATGELKKLTLVLDFGSSTLDATLAIGEDEIPLDDPGVPLGASWLDKAILHWNLIHCTDASFPGGPQDSAKILSYIEASPSNRNRVEFEVRKKKEVYFNALDEYESPASCLNQALEDLSVRNFYVVIHGEMMKELLNTPLEQIVPELTTVAVSEDVRRELVGYSWLGRCRKFLGEIVAKLEQEGKKATDVERVLLTGGASLMKPVRQLVAEVFPTSASNTIVFDTEPSLCITRGLTCWGRIEIQTRAFKEEITSKLFGEEGALFGIVRDAFQKATFEEIVATQWRDRALSELRQWRDGTQSYRQIGRWIAHFLGDWVSSGKMANAIRSEVERMESAIRREVNNVAQKTFEKYHIAGMTFLAKTQLFDVVNTVCELIIRVWRELAEKNTAFEDLSDNWFYRRLFTWDSELVQDVDRRKQFLKGTVIKLLYHDEEICGWIFGSIYSAVRDDIEKAIGATQFLLDGMSPQDEKAGAA